MPNSTLAQLVGFILALNALEGVSSYEKVSKYCSFQETGLSYEKKIISTDNPCKNIWPKLENQQNQATAKNFDICFFVFFNCYCQKSLFL